MENIRWQINQHKKHSVPSFSELGIEQIQKVMSFHQSLSGYEATPLLLLKCLAKDLGLGEILVKDESYRFGLNSFKGLGSSYAISSYLKDNSNSLAKLTFATATDGNHGRGIAWAAKQFNQQAVVYMPKGSSKYRLEKIRELGAQAEITNLNYDDTVRYVAQLSKERGWILMQDTAWENYKEIPLLIMQGYLTILGECIENFREKGYPSHVILQAGVGSFAASIVSGLSQLSNKPITFVIVEPTQADCFFQSVSSVDGTPKNTSGNLSTIMAGLSCGEPNPVAWDILKNFVECFVTCPDNVAARGMRILGNPLKKDPRIISGESGAIPLGLLYEICKNPILSDLKKSLKLDLTSRIFFISTEGDTDPDNYRAICWDGLYAN